MADVIHMNYFTLSVLNRFGIELGFGDKTVQEVCEDNHVDLDFFLEITNTFVDNGFFLIRSNPFHSASRYLKTSFVLLSTFLELAVNAL